MKKSLTLKERVFRFLENSNWAIVEDTALFMAGELDRDNYIIFYNPIYGDRVITVIHEILHVFYPKLSEKRIEGEAIRLYCSLTQKEIEDLLTYIACLQLK